MSKAEERAWEWAVKNKLDPYSMGQAYAEGYHQAEKDLELGWKDMKLIWNITDEMDNMPEEEFYQEVLKRFKNLKKNRLNNMIFLKIFILIEIVGLILFIYEIKHAPLYPPDYDI